MKVSLLLQAGIHQEESRIDFFVDDFNPKTVPMPRQFGRFTTVPIIKDDASQTHLGGIVRFYLPKYSQKVS